MTKEHEPLLIAYLSSFFSDRQVVEEVAQRTLNTAYRKIDSLQSSVAFPVWLRGIARLEAFATLRRQGREPAIDVSALEQMDEAYRQFERCYQRLPETLHSVCRLCYFEGRQVREISDLLAFNLDAVLKRLEGARAAVGNCVRQQLAPNFPAYIRTGTRSRMLQID